MFESDQHEFDEQYDEIGHIAPPPAPAKAQEVAPSAAQVRPVSPSSADAAPAGGNYPHSASSEVPAAFPKPVAGSEPEELEEEDPDDDFEYEPQPESLEFHDPAEQQPEPPPPPEKKKLNLILIGGFAALAIFTIFVVYTATRPKDNSPAPGDMGPGIVAASGLRGHLNARWDGDSRTGHLAYQMRIEPMEDRWQAGFSKVISKAPLPISVNVRLMDASGFALCGKEIDFHFDPQNASVASPSVPAVGPNGKKLSAAEHNAEIQAARQSALGQMQAAEAAREHGKDIFQGQTGPDGEMTAANVQGTLPCSPDQFKRADYWDFNTNFPTLEEQEALVDPRAAALRAKEADAASHPGRRSRPRLPQEGFIIQGDDRVTGYDSVRGMLLAQEGKTFQIDRRFGQATATAWANNNSLIHYRCDQQANCALTAAGGAAVLHARLSD